jgi:hypothetical protein
MKFEPQTFFIGILDICPVILCSPREVRSRLSGREIFYTSFSNLQLPLLKVAALYFDKLVDLDPVGGGWATIGVDHHAREAFRQVGP